MAVGKEIRTQIASIQNTQKITSAMKMVAASKMKKAQLRMGSSRPYAQKIQQIIGHLAFAHSEFKHPYMDTRAIKKVGYIVISSDRGLCGGLNNNLFRTLLKDIAKWELNSIDAVTCAIGKKSLSFLKSFGSDIVSSVSDLGDSPHFDDMIGVIKIMLDKYDAGEVDRLYLVNNFYVNTMTQQPTINQILPFEPEKSQALNYHWDYIYEPSSKEVLDDLLTRYIEVLVYQGVVENIACEQAARMVAMQSATDNAGEMVKNLQLIYNKARQAAITQEISEIVSGAAAV